MAESGRPLDFRALVDEHYAALYRYAYRLCGAAADAEDLTQETFCTAQVKLSPLRDPVCARGWPSTCILRPFKRENMRWPARNFAGLATTRCTPS